MNFQFEYDFESEEMTVIVEHKTVGVFYRDESGAVKCSKLSKSFEDYRTELTNVVSTLTTIVIDTE